MLLFASALKNPHREPIEDAAVWVEGDTVWFAGPRRDLPSEALEDAERLELGDAVLAPGLVNAHAHLELSSLAKLSYPGSFVAWIRSVLQTKNQLSSTAQEHSLPKGLMQSLVGGTTTVGDHISVTGDLEALLFSPLRGKAFVEIIGVVPEVAEDILRAALSLKKDYENFPTLIETLPSPHSVHALVPKVLEKVLRQNQSLFSLHLAESEAERQYFESQSGPMEEFIAQRGTHLKRSGKSAVQELSERGLLTDRILAIHGNYLEENEIKLLAEKGISIVHCPYSHRYFSHRPFDLRTCLKNGINVALGTDSLASAETLSMFEVMREAVKNLPDLNPEQVFAMATTGGAKALKLETQVGTIEAGKKADLIAVSRPGRISPMQAIFHAKRVAFSMIDGKIVLT